MKTFENIKIHPHLSLIIPAFNAAHCLQQTCKRIYDYLQEQTFSFEIILLNDGSTDQTNHIIEELQKTYLQVRGISIPLNQGKGYVVRLGMLSAKGTIRCFFDADGSTDISYIQPATQKIAEGYEVVIASRSPRDAKGARQVKSQRPLRRFMGLSGNLLIQFLGVRGIWDTQCGFKLFTAHAAEAIFSRIKTKRWAFDVEALLLAKQLGFSIGIIPVRWFHNNKSSVDYKSYIQTIGELVKIRRRHYHGLKKSKISKKLLDDVRI